LRRIHLQIPRENRGGETSGVPRVTFVSRKSRANLFRAARWNVRSNRETRPRKWANVCVHYADCICDFMEIRWNRKRSLYLTKWPQTRSMKILKCINFNKFSLFFSWILQRKIRDKNTTRYCQRKHFFLLIIIIIRVWIIANNNNKMFSLTISNFFNK